MKKSYIKTASDTLTNSFADFVLIPLVFVRLPLLTKNLSSDEYGIWSLIFTTVSLLTPFTTLGLGVAMSRFLPAEKNLEKIRNSFYSVLLFRLMVVTVILVIILLFESVIADHLFNGSRKLVAITGALLLLNILESIYMRLVTILRNIKLRTIIKIINGYLPIFCIAILFLNGYGLMSIILAVLAIKSTIVIFLAIHISLRIGLSIPDLSMIKDYLKFGLPTLPSSMGFWLVNLTDRYIILYLLGPAQVGIYFAAYQLGNIPYIFSSLINFIIMVATSKLYDEGKIDEVRTHLSYSLKYFIALTIPFIFGMTILSGQLLRIFSTTEIALEGYFVTPLVALANLFLGVYSILKYILLLTKKTKLMATIWLVAAPFNIILNILLIPIIGINGAALATVISYFLSMCVAGYFSFKEISFRIDILFLIKSIFSSLIMSIFIWYMKPWDGIFDIIITLVIGALLYILLLLLLRAFNQNELLLIKSLIKNRKS